MVKKNIDDEKVKTFVHDEAKRKNIPTAEHQTILEQSNNKPKKIKYSRNTDLDPQLVWRGKDEKDWSDLIVNAPNLYIQEKVHPKVLIDNLVNQTKRNNQEQKEYTYDLFSDFDGVSDDFENAEFYEHDQNWTNRMILGDSLQVMASLAELEGLRGSIQCIYIDPPYGIKFNSNFQWSTSSTSVKDGSKSHITREPEQVKAFRDTWNDGIHSYLSYLRDRLILARDLLKDSGSIFVQIGDENVHRIRILMDEVFGDKNFVSLIPFRTKTRPLGGDKLEGMLDYICYYAKDNNKLKFRTLFNEKNLEGDVNWKWIEEKNGLRRKLTKDEISNHSLLPEGSKLFRTVDIRPAGKNESATFDFTYQGKKYSPPGGNSWLTNELGMQTLAKAGRLVPTRSTLERIYFQEDFSVSPETNLWHETRGAVGKKYIVETNQEIIKRCLLMSTDPGDIVLDPTCGSGTTANVAEEWGRRWITIDTSRVALAIARARIMGSHYPYYLLNDSVQGKEKLSEINNEPLNESHSSENISLGFVYKKVPHITLGSIVRNSEIDTIWSNWKKRIDSLLQELNESLNQNWNEWDIPNEINNQWTEKIKKIYSQIKESMLKRQREIDKSIHANAEYESLTNKPYIDKSKVRVAGPFTVESLSPIRSLGFDEENEVFDSLKKDESNNNDFNQMVLENLKTAGVHQVHKEGKIKFISLSSWPGDGFISAVGVYMEKEEERKAGIFIGPEFGSVQRIDLINAAKECSDAGLDILISCAFNYDVHATDFTKLGNISILKSRINADLQMAADLKNTGSGNLFVIFGEPDITIEKQSDDKIKVKLNGVDIFKPQTGEIITDGIDGVACWFVDTDYNEESFFVRQAYFLGTKDPYQSLKSTLKGDINKEVWESLRGDISCSFNKPESGRIAVKVINHLGDEVMKVFRV